MACGRISSYIPARLVQVRRVAHLIPAASVCRFIGPRESQKFSASGVEKGNALVVAVSAIHDTHERFAVKGI